MNITQFFMRFRLGKCGWLLPVLVILISLSTVPVHASDSSFDRRTIQSGAITNQGDTLVVDGDDVGRRYYGIGAITQGGSTRLLIDYPKPQRSEILDYLFKPGYGASLQVLKVGMGGGANATDGSEPSHERVRGEVNCDRGWEWWIMKQAKKRNPDITLVAQEWSAPGWLDGIWSDDNVEYHLSWLKCAEQHGLKIDYIGGWNEQGYESEFFIKLDKALEKHYPYVDIPAADEINDWGIAADMAKNPDLMKAVDAVAVHFPCTWRSHYRECASSDTAKMIDKPLWLAANSALGWDNGAGPHARAFNRMYIDGKMVQYMTWNLAESRYGNLPLANTGLMGAKWPWSGYYQLGNNLWSFAHTAQVTEVGWHYLDTGSRRLENGATIASLKSPDHEHYSLILEAMDLKEVDTLDVHLENLPAKNMQMRVSNFGTDDQSRQFLDAGSIVPHDGKFQIIVKPNHVYSITTKEQQIGKGQAAAPSNIHARLPLPFHENFEGVEEGKMAPLFTPVNGAFEVQPCKGEREGKCYQQMVTIDPINWNDSGDMPPTSMVGDPRWWSDYSVRADVRLEKTGYVEIIGRISGQLGWTPYLGGYHFRVGSDGWKIYNEDSPSQTVTPIDSGSTAIEPGTWHTVQLNMRANRVELFLDEELLASFKHRGQLQGNVGLRASKWQQAQFDNVTIIPTGPQPEFVPYDSVSIAQVSSVQNYWGGWTFEATNVIDDRLGTQWQSKRTDGPDSITLDLGSVKQIEALWLRPRRPYFDKNNRLNIIEYKVQVSTGGSDFTTVDEGRWPATGSSKIAAWDGKVSARYVRLIAVENTTSAASASEIRLIRELPDSWEVFQ